MPSLFFTPYARARMLVGRVVVGVLLPVVVLAGCGAEPTTQQVYSVRGQFVSPAYGGEAMLVDHEPIPGYMEAMRMTFRLEDPAELHAVSSGDKIRFEFVVREDGAFARGIEVLPPETELDLAEIRSAAPDSM